MKFRKAADAFKLLNGVFCVYKPPETNILTVQKSLKRDLLQDLSDLENRSIRTYKQPILVADASSSRILNVGYENALDYSSHPLVIGSSYEEHDLEIRPVRDMSYESSGVCLIAINQGVDEIQKINNARFLKVYHITGRFGRATLDFLETGKIVEKTTFGHITPEKINHTAARIIRKFEKLTLQHGGFHIQSQEAFRLASRGLIRPAEDSSTIVYFMKCIDFRPPYFTVEVHTINETEQFLLNFINDFGLNLRSTACTAKFRLVRNGHFTVDHALLKKHWTLEHVINNISRLKPLLSADALKTGRILDETNRQDVFADPKRKYLEALTNDFEKDDDETFDVNEEERDEVEERQQRTLLKVPSYLPLLRK